MGDNKHNGWTNYATWRVNLEILSDIDWQEDPFYEMLSVSYLEELVEETVFKNKEKYGLVGDYAQAFLSEVNYYEILEHIKEEVDNENQARNWPDKND